MDPDNTQHLYYVNENNLYRNTQSSTATNSNWTNMNSVGTAVGVANDITVLSTSRGTYNSSTSSLFIGTNDSKVYRLDDPANASSSTAPVNISSGLPFTIGYISSISVNPRNDDTILVTLSNYGINSIWWTGNANAASPTWRNVEGNLSIPSIRSSAIVITPEGVEYFVGTSVGLYNTMINASSPSTTAWSQEGATEIGNALVSSLALRTADNKLLVGTHGYGMWSANISYVVLPVSMGKLTADKVNENALLKWDASHEGETGGFDIEKSPDGINFKKLGFVAFTPNTSGTVSYSYTDTDLWSGDNYYRLRAHELSGSAKVSNIVRVRKDANQNLFFTNPFYDKIEVRFAIIPKSIRILVTDAGGKLSSY